jgi:hypothetical protein
LPTKAILGINAGVVSANTTYGASPQELPNLTQIIAHCLRNPTCPAMPSLASLAKRVILANKIARKTSSSDFYFDDRRHARIVPLPLDISNRIPQELYERFLEYLRDDRASLSFCSLVCRAWWPACRYHLRRSLTVLPNVIVGNAEAMFMNCAVPLRKFLAIYAPLPLRLNLTFVTRHSRWIKTYFVWYRRWSIHV